MYTEEKPERTCDQCCYEFGLQYYKCKHPQSIEKYSVITGLPIYTECEEMRSTSGPCGLEGKLFEPKLSLINRIKNIINR